MHLTLTQIASLAAFSWVVWKLLKLFVVRNGLDNVPGPKSRSFLIGKLHHGHTIAVVFDLVTVRYMQHDACYESSSYSETGVL